MKIENLGEAERLAKRLKHASDIIEYADGFQGQSAGKPNPVLFSMRSGAEGGGRRVDDRKLGILEVAGVRKAILEAAAEIVEATTRELREIGIEPDEA